MINYYLSDDVPGAGYVTPQESGPAQPPSVAWSPVGTPPCWPTLPWPCWMGAPSGDPRLCIHVCQASRPTTEVSRASVTEGEPKVNYKKPISNPSSPVIFISIVLQVHPLSKLYIIGVQVYSPSRTWNVFWGMLDSLLHNWLVLNESLRLRTSTRTLSLFLVKAN